MGDLLPARAVASRYLFGGGQEKKARQLLEAGIEFLLAQFNIGRMRDDVDAARVARFVAAVDPINRLAESSPGFVWRHEESPDTRAMQRAELRS